MNTDEATLGKQDILLLLLLLLFLVNSGECIVFLQIILNHTNI